MADLLTERLQQTVNRFTIEPERPYHLVNIGEVTFFAEVYTAKMNTAADWMLTLKVPYRDREQVHRLTDIPGLLLEVTVRMKGAEG